MTRPDILVPGNYFCDVIFTGFPAFPALGTEVYTRDLNVVPGGVLNTVVAMRRLGVHVAWAGALGNDFFSRFIDEWTAGEGVDLSLMTRIDSPLQRVTVSLSYPQDRAFVTYVDPSPSVAELLETALDKATPAHLHFSGLTMEPGLPEMLRACRAQGVVISTDCQHRDETLDHPLVRELLSLADIFMPNASEARRLTGTDTIEAAVAILAPLVPLLVIKDGANGASAWRDGECIHSPALRVDPVDTTGAGDVFNAGFLAAYHAGRDIETCLRWGNIAGGLSTLGHGGCAAAPTLEELQGWLP